MNVNAHTHTYTTQACFNCCASLCQTVCHSLCVSLSADNLCLSENGSMVMQILNQL